MASVERLAALFEEKDWTVALTEYQLLVDGGEVPATAHWQGGLSAWKQGKTHLARTILERGMSSGPDRVTELKLHFAHAHILRELGETQPAIEEWERYLSASACCPDMSTAEASAHYNLALCYRQARQWSKAIDAYQQATYLAGANGESDLRRRSLQNLAWALCAAKQWEDAEEALMQAEGLSNTTEAKAHQTVGFAYLRYVRGDSDGSWDLCQELKRAHQDGHTVPDDVLAQVYWLMGAVQFDRGLLASAQVLAEIAVERAQAYGDHRCLHDASELHRRVMEAKQSASA